MAFKELYLPQNPEIKHNSVLVVTGVSGSGKNFLINQAINSDLQIKKGINVVGVGEFITSKFGKLLNVTSRDELKFLPQADLLRVTLELIDEILELEPVIANTHIVNKQQGSLAVNPEVNRKINPEGYIHVWADPDQIKHWRDNDTRLRTAESVEDIELHQDISATVVYEIAKHLGSSMINVYNYPENTQKNVDNIIEQAQTILNK